ncbi:MAG: hypothetical protein RL404_423 [Pseudomonadota bacterium]
MNAVLNPSPDEPASGSPLASTNRDAPDANGMARVPALSVRDLFSYGMFGLPLALVALPVYVLVPQLYAGSLGLSLSAVGTILLAARLLDAFIDPLFGLWIDARARQRGHAGFVLLAVPLLACGYLALMHPPAMAPDGTTSQLALGAWFGASLVLVYAGYSLATIAHNSWGANLAPTRGARARLTAVREGWALAGVVMAAALPALAGLPVLSAAFIVMLVTAATVLLRHAPRPVLSGAATHDPAIDWRAPLRIVRFRWLLAVFALNGIAAAIPATLFLFFASDRLQLGAWSGLFLVLYFIAAALALPLWAGLASRFGEKRAWLASMLLAIAAFGWTALLDSGALAGFAAICALSGVALGADLALPPALLAGVIHAAGDSGKREGAYFGCWSWVTKLNLALAAGIALPLLEVMGYVPGTSDEAGTRALLIAYAVLPCALKAGAAVLLWRAPLDDV